MIQTFSSSQKLDRPWVHMDTIADDLGKHPIIREHGADDSGVAMAERTHGVENVRGVSRSRIQGALRFLEPRRAARLAAERRRRAAGEPPTVIPVVSKEAGVECALPTPDSYAWFTETAAKRAPSWRNEVTLLSGDHGRLTHPGDYVPYISPTPLLMIVAERDVLTPAAPAKAVFERAGEPKRLVSLPGGHFDAYVDEFPESSSAARDWFKLHLIPALVPA